MNEEKGMNGDDLMTKKNFNKSPEKIMANKHGSNVKSSSTNLVQTRKSMRRISKSIDNENRQLVLEENITKKTVTRKNISTNGIIDKMMVNTTSTNGDKKSSIDSQISPEISNDAELPDLNNIQKIDENNKINNSNDFSTSNGDKKSKKTLPVSKEKKGKKSLKDNPSISTIESDKNELEIAKIETPKRRGRPKRSQPVQSQLITNFFTPKKADNINNNLENQESSLEADESMKEIKNEIEAENNKEEIETPRRYPGRPRKRRGSNLTPSLSIPEEVTLPPRKRARKNSSETDGKGLSESDSEVKIEKQKSKNDDEPYVPRVRSKKSNMQITKFLKTESDKPLTCGKCKEVVTNWPYHNLSVHYNTGWLEGEKEPDFSDRTFLRDLKRALDKVKKKKFTCELCKSTLNSVDGFISHILFCGKTEEEREALMWQCPTCHRVFKPISIYSHERYHKIQKEAKTTNGQNPELFNDKSKRKAAEKAREKFAGLDEGSSKNNKMSSKMEELIQVNKPEVIPAAWKSTWKSSIDSNEPAVCQQIGCKFSTNSFDEIIEHFSQCSFKPVSIYKCKVCKSFTGSEAEVLNHIRQEHPSEVNEDSDFIASDDDQDSDDDNNSGFHLSTRKPYRGGKPSSFVRAKFLNNLNQSQTGNRHATFIPALRWTMEFELKNHQPKIFVDLKPNKFHILTKNSAEEYLPKQLSSISMKNQVYRKLFADKNIPSDWKKWKRFEAGVVDDVPTFFTGGPVWAIAWLPISSKFYSEDPTQYLALSTHPNMNDTYQVNKSYAFKNSIQIWEIGHLALGTSFTPTAPKCGYVFAHDNGTVWSLEWCPSGAYKTSERMGLLAAGSSDGCVYIYSLPFPDVIKSSTIDPPVIKFQPVMTLHVHQDFEDTSMRNWQCMKVCWSKTNGHNILAAGFSNGYVALWDLNLKSSLLASNRGNTIHLDAFRHFYAHGNAVMHVEIIPFGGQRYLATVGMDREAKTWDLEDISSPLDGFKKGVTVNAAWISHWPALITSYDDALGLAHTQTYLTVVREAAMPGDGRIFPMLPTNSPCYGLATSDWANGICHSTVAGEIAAIFPTQMMYVRDFDKLSKTRWLISSAKVVDFEKSEDNMKKTIKKVKQKIKPSNEYEYKPELYEDCHERFGIIFKDDLTRSQPSRSKRSKKNTINSDTMAMFPIEQYPFTSINRVSIFLYVLFNLLARNKRVENN